MKNKLFVDHACFWSFWANILFIFGIIGYLVMDILCYTYSNTFNSLFTNITYIILASIFVINSTLQFFVIYYIKKTTQRYYTMILSCIFDEIGSHAYLIGAILSTFTVAKLNTIWTLNTIGVCGFVIGALLNMMIPEVTNMYLSADYLNLLGSLFYLLAVIITRMSVSQIIAIFGDFIYLIDSFLYMICWFQDRKRITIDDKQYTLLK